MTAYRPILLDLDGTVANTYPGIVAAAEAALDAVGLPRVDADHVCSLTGRGVRALVDGLLAALGPPPEEAVRERLLTIYTETYERTCAHGATAYPGMVELIGRLPGPLALLTNKPRKYTEQIAERLGFGHRFATIVAGDDAGDIEKLKPNPWPIREALRRLDVPDCKPILVGDTVADVLAARTAGVACCVVRWGHGGAQALELASMSVGDVDQLERVLLGSNADAVST